MLYDDVMRNTTDQTAGYQAQHSNANTPWNRSTAGHIIDSLGNRVYNLRPFFRTPVVLIVECEVCEEDKPGATRKSGLVLCDDCYTDGVADSIIDADGFFA
jgi:hypothetical protein